MIAINSEGGKIPGCAILYLLAPLINYSVAKTKCYSLYPLSIVVVYT